jgi:hypothetical protein
MKQAARRREPARIVAMLSHPAATANREIAMSLVLNSNVGRGTACKVLVAVPAASARCPLALPSASPVPLPGAADGGTADRVVVRSDAHKNAASWDAAAVRAGRFKARRRRTIRGGQTRSKSWPPRLANVTPKSRPDQPRCPLAAEATAATHLGLSGGHSAALSGSGPSYLTRPRPGEPLPAPASLDYVLGIHRGRPSTRAPRVVVAPGSAIVLAYGSHAHEVLGHDVIAMPHDDVRERHFLRRPFPGGAKIVVEVPGFALVGFLVLAVELRTSSRARARFSMVSIRWAIFIPLTADRNSPSR